MRSRIQDSRPEEPGPMNGTDDQPGMILRAFTSLLACHDLPDEAPADPLPLFIAWFEEARRSGRYDDFNAMTLATATPDGVPSARIVLCKAIEPDPAAVVFYTSYESRKGRELTSNPRAAAVFHWPHAKRQVRVEGDVTRVTAEESDAYFRTRPLLSRIGATVSSQSAPIGSRAELVSAAIKLARGAAITGTLIRPPYWGGYRLGIRSIELWSARQGRLHDRIRWTRSEAAGPVLWSAQRISA